MANTKEDFLNSYKEVQRKVAEIETDFKTDKISFKYWLKETREILSRFLNLYDETEFANTTEFKKLSNRCWELGSY